MRMMLLRVRRALNLKTLIFIGAGSVLFTFLLFLVFSEDLHHQELRRKEMILKAKLVPSRKAGQPKIIHRLIDVVPSTGTGRDGNIAFHLDFRPPLTVPRILKYCNPPHSMEMGNEGLVPEDYKLLNVHVVIRHGDRSPINRLPTDTGSDLSCLTDTSQFAHIPKVTNFVQVMAVQSQRRPRDNVFHRWAMYPTHTRCSDGQLTGRGAIQHILNGLHYSQRYYHQHQLFDDINWDKKVVVHTTEVSRTYQSAVAFMYGLLPSFDVTKLNLKGSKNINFCEEKVFGAACMCVGIENLRTRAVRECKIQADYVELMKKYEHVLSYIQSVLGVERSELPYPSALMDGLSKYSCHNVAPPCNSHRECITAKTVEAVWKPVDYQSKCQHRNAKYKSFCRALIHGLLYRIAREMKIAIQNGTNPTFHLYSGHDTTVSPLITALELEDAVWPGYASRLVFELYHKQSTSEQFLRLLLNGKVVTSQAVFCKDKTLDGLCSFSQFDHYVSAQNLQEFCHSIKPTQL